MSELVSDDVTDFVRAVGPQPDEVLTEMDEYGEEIGFPTVGPAVGGWLATLARLVDAERVFEFGSGFGYSAYWFARALPPTGEVVLTEIDADELDRAREYFDRGDLTERATFEHGDAIETVDDYEGPFDVVLIDNEKDRYEEAFDAVREKVAPGGVVIADNAMTSTSVDFETVLELVEGETVKDANESTRGVAAYLERVRADPDFETAAIPLGEGIAVSHRTE
ncbi:MULTISPECIES: O-methyltransferase [Halococcus]|uniref:O-methyltransferase family protein n=1 Tax=Halococcus salifodinae DSM 8989 TaxID=1227456 RepID=M0N5Y3_9EURY|nr:MULTISPECIES: O-methyltransferase [Halococcus]EMA53291.1 O-methyltransferase family protein [Halococcus salifodinae DSM 8989]